MGTCALSLFPGLSAVAGTTGHLTRECQHQPGDDTDDEEQAGEDIWGVNGVDEDCGEAKGHDHRAKDDRVASEEVVGRLQYTDDAIHPNTSFSIGSSSISASPGWATCFRGA